MDTNYKTLQNELGFTDGGSVYGVAGRYDALQVFDEGGKYEVNILFYMWTNVNIPQSYRIPIVVKKVFKLYFGKDAMKVWNYCDKNDIPDNFIAKKVHVTFDDNSGSVVFHVGRK